MSCMVTRIKLKPNVWYQETKQKVFFMWHIETEQHGFVDFTIITKDGNFQKQRKALHNVDWLGTIPTVVEVANPETLEVLYGK